MLKERLQVLVSTEQRRRLEEEARLRGTSVAALVRDAIDATLSGPSIDERRLALTRIAEMNGRYLPPEELAKLIDKERDGVVPTDVGR